MVAIIMCEDGERLADIHELWPGEYTKPDPEPELDFRPYIYSAD